MSIRIGTNNLGTTFKNKSNPEITLNQKPNQHITAKIERYWEQIEYDNSFELRPVTLKNKLHLHVHSTNSQYAHGQLSWTPNTFVNGTEAITDMEVNVTDATYINVTIPEGYTAYYFGPNNKLYEDTNYDNQIEPANVTGKVALYNVDDYLSSSSSFNGVWSSSIGSQTITHLDLSYLDISKIRSVSGLIPSYGYNPWGSGSPLTTINISNWYSNNITNFSRMFNNSGITTIIGLDALSTSNATSMSSMFSECSNLTSLNVSNFDTNKVTSMGNMFSMCSKLASIDLTNFDTTNVSDFSYMFNCCSALTSLDLSGFQTYNATNIMYLAAECENLKILDISNFDTTKITDSLHQMWLVNAQLNYLIIGSPTFRMPLIRSDAIVVPSTCKILVPANLISTYQNATNWAQHSAKFDAIENYNITRSNGQVTVTPKNA